MPESPCPPRHSVLVVFAVVAALLTGCSTGTTPRSFDPDAHDIIEISAAMSRGETSATALVEHYLARIAAGDDAGPALAAVTVLAPDARDRARQLDADRPAHPGPLYGIPFLVKENIDVAGMVTTAGSAALRTNVADRNATAVQRLVDAGAIVLGRTNMSELAASHGRFGYSSAGGQTRNPYALQRDASGSSSGTAAAVAADFAVFGLGTDTSGSVRAPASVTGQTGLRPTTGLISRTGVLPLSATFDTVGPITRDASDQSVILDAVAADDPADPVGRVAPPSAEPDPASFTGRRIGVVTGFAGGDGQVDSALGRAVTMIRDAGAETVPVDLGDDVQNLWSRVLEPVGDAEFSDDYAAHMASSRPGNPRTVEQLLAASIAPSVARSGSPVNPGRLDGYRTAITRQGLDDDPAITRIRTATMPTLRRGVEAAMERDRLDALVFATTACSASVRFDAEDPTYRCSVPDPYAASYVASATGLPEMTTPMGMDTAGIPIGLSFLGSAFTERRLIELAMAWEDLHGPTPEPAAAP